MKQIPLFGSSLRKVDLVIDVANMVYRAHHRFNVKQQPPMACDGKPTGHIYGTVSMLLSMLRQHGVGRDVRFVFAMEGGCTWRRELFAAYKANRGEARGHSSIDEVTEYLAAMPGLTITAPGQEADDAIAAHISRNPTRQHVVLSMDRDLWQLAGKSNVSVVIGTKEKPITVYDVAETFLTTRPELVPLAKACLGDTSDNIPGVMRFARDDLKVLLARQPPHLGQSSEDIAQSLLETSRHAPDMKPRTCGLIESSLEQIARSHRIATLQHASELTVQTNIPNRQALQSKLEAIECFSMAERLGEIYR